MALVNAWTGRTACALQDAMRLSNELFAERLGIASRTVAAWHQKPDLRPNSEMQHRLDNAFEHAPETVKNRFAELIGEHTEPTSASGERDQAIAEAERRLITDPDAAAILEWLDRSAGWKPGTSRRKVATHIAQLGLGELQDRGLRRGRVDQRQIADSLNTYYSGDLEDYGTYRARVDTTRHAITSILTRPAWLDLECALTTESDRLDLASGSIDNSLILDDLSAGMAVRRLAEMMVLGFRLVDSPLYRLVDIDVRKGVVGGSLSLVPFVRYALTMDLLEGELVDAIAAGHGAGAGSLPLRDRLMPDLPAAVNVSSRLCSGGALALCAIARPGVGRRPPDYVLLVQERSGRVLNAARRLAVIPKGFHEPLVDYRADAQISTTLMREMEEELFGRDDVDSTAEGLRAADPLHSSRLSEPMRWLLGEAGRLRIECTAFGLNLVSGNCEFAGLIVIDDEDFWPQYGGQISANWESSSLRQYSSLDRELIAELISDVAWSNEGLFALLQGLRRLAEIGGNRVDLPTIEWELR